jgi:LuxR family transcriptional regulator, maltose regulon positive regulatory protein
MSAPILASKLYIPLPRPKVVLRQRLIEHLNEGLYQNQNFGRILTLISAPAGFGKTTLVSEWADRLRHPLPQYSDRYEQSEPKIRIAWLSLDEGDNDPSCFLTYLVAALQTISNDIGKGILGAIQTSQPLTTINESLLATLLNEIAAIPDNLILVLDDYHVIDSESIDHALTYLLDHLPLQMHLVITTREDPSLPLPRYRARGQLIEVRAADLRFTPEEAGAFLNQLMNLNLSAENISALETRTEGWIAGLQLAALSMQGRDDIASFIQAFTGSHRFVLDYLAEEVLQHQSAHIRSFLLQTAILDRFCVPLCNAVTEREDGKEMLDVLERSNLFLIPLDDDRQWYRYHHLFADVLQAHLMEAQSELVSNLHQRASMWYEHNGMPHDAIRHALAAKDHEHAAGLIELARPEMDISYQSTIWLGWVKMLPEEIIHARPILCAGYAWALLDVGELEASETRLKDAERWLDMPTEEMVVVDKEQFCSLPASIATARAYRSLALGNVSETVKYALQALELTPEDDLARYMQATSLLGLAQYTRGDLEPAECSIAEFYMNLQKIGEIPTLVGITFLLADIRVVLGRLHDAESIYQQSLRLAVNHGEPIPLGTADLYRGLSELFVEWGDLGSAAQYIQTSQKLAGQVTLTDWPYRLCVSQAHLKVAQGDLDGALALLNEAERVHIRSPLPDVRPVAALKVQIWLKQGRLAEALGWVREQGLSVDDDICYVREFAHITLARVLIAAGKSDREAGSLDEATRLLGRLLQAAETGGRLGSAIQILLLQALLFQAQDNLPQALAQLEHALSLAEPEGYVHIFVDEGEQMRLLITKHSHNLDHRLSIYADKILSAFSQPVTAPKSPSPGRAREIIHQRADMIEPLSERELEVLKLLHSELSGPEIALQLVVSLNTLRTHTKNIFNKLGVNTRRAAIRRAEELDLF